MRKFKALETIEGMITKGNVYQESRQYTGFQSCIHVIGDDGFEKTLFEERFEEVFDYPIKPPLGLRPEFVVLELRQREIQEAVTRYMEAGKEIPKEWTAEYYRNSSRLMEVL